MRHELISVFCFSFCLLSHGENSNDLITAQLSSTLAAGNLISGFQTWQNSNQAARLRLEVSCYNTIYTAKHVCAYQGPELQCPLIVKVDLN